MPQAIRYYQAAMALRPEVPSAHYCLGTVLSYAGRPDESNAEFREVIRLEPGYPHSHGVLAAAWTRLGDFDRAFTEVNAAIRETPKYAQLYYLLGEIYTFTGHDAQAVEPFRHALLLQPNQPLALRELRFVLQRLGRPSAEIIAAWKAQINASPTDPEVSDGYAEYCLFAGQEDEYRSARSNLLSHFQNSDDPRTCERIGRACVLLPASPEELKQANALIDRAVSAGKSGKSGYYQYFRFAKAIAEYRAGHYETTISICGEVGEILGPAPRLVLAMAQCRQGQFDRAKATLKQAVPMFDWTAVKANNREAWMYHILRRQAEATILDHAGHANVP
jgi:tetratricopeptide (TPR) repeat protein